jgi:hypothetical protein
MPTLGVGNFSAKKKSKPSPSRHKMRPAPQKNPNPKVAASYHDIRPGFA